MTIKNFSVKNGLTAGNITLNATTSAISTSGNITVGNANLGNLATANFFQGDGGLLTNISTTGGNSITNGNSNVAISENSNITVSVSGNANIAVFSGTGINIAGYTTITGDLTVGSKSNLGPVGNVTITGGTANYLLATDGTGNLRWVVPAGGSNVAGTTDSFTGTGEQTTFTLSSVPVSPDLTFVNIGGILQLKTSYTVSGTNVIFSSPPLNGTKIEITAVGGNVSGSIDYAANAGNIVISAQPNITSVGTLTTLSVSGDANLGNAVTANFFIGNGSLLTGLPAGYSNADVANYLPTYTGNILAGNANLGNLVIANYFSGNGSQLTGVKLNVSESNGTGGNVTNSISSISTLKFNRDTGIFVSDLGEGTALVSLGSTFKTWKITGQPDLVAVGEDTIQFIEGSGITISTSNVSDPKSITFTSNNVANANYANLAGTADTANSVAGANVSGQVANALIAGTVYTNAQPNITSTGTLTSLSVSGNANVSSLNADNAVITGNLTVQGNTTYVNVDTLVVEDPLIEMGGGPNGAVLTTNDGKDRGSLLHYYSGSAIDAFMGWDNSNAEFAFGSNVTVSNDVVTVNTLGNVRANYFIGNGSQLTGLPASYTDANVAAYLPTYTGNITANNIIASNSITATSFTADGAGGNISGADYVIANFFSGNGSLLTGLPAGYTDANVAAYLPTYTGNISAGNATIGEAAYGAISVTSTSGFSVPWTPAQQSAAWTISFWLFDGGIGNSPKAIFYNGDSGTTNTTFAYGLNGGVYSLQLTSGGVNTAKTLSGSLSGTWRFITVSYDGSNTRYIGVDGDVSASSGGAGSAYSLLVFGKGTGTSSAVNTYGDATFADVALTLGSAQYTSNFTPPTTHPTSAGKSLLMLTKSANNYLINEVTGANVTLYNTPTFVSSNPIGATGDITVFNQITVAGNITSKNANLGNAATANFFVGDGSLLTGLPAGYSNADVANYLPTYTGNIAALNANLGNAATANFFIGDGGLLTNIAVPSGTSITNGNSDVSVSANSNITVSVAGTANVVTFTDTGVNVAGYTNLTGNLTVGSISNLGPASNVIITGGTANYVLSTDGTGNLSWIEPAVGSQISVDTFTGNGVQTTFVLSESPANVNLVTVNYNGVILLRDSFTLSGANLQFTNAPSNNSKLEITTFVPKFSGGGGGGASDARAMGYSLVFGG